MTGEETEQIVLPERDQSPRKGTNEGQEEDDERILLHVGDGDRYLEQLSDEESERQLDIATEVDEEGPRPCGPAAIQSNTQGTAGQFNITMRKPERLERVKKVLVAAFNCTVGANGEGVAPKLRYLKLPTRRDVLTPQESSTVAKELILAAEKGMLQAGFHGLGVPLVQEELQFLRSLVQKTAWNREGPCLQNKAKKSKIDAW